MNPGRETTACLARCSRSDADCAVGPRTGMSLPNRRRVRSKRPARRSSPWTSRQRDKGGPVAECLQAVTARTYLGGGDSEWSEHANLRDRPPPSPSRFCGCLHVLHHGFIKRFVIGDAALAV